MPANKSEAVIKKIDELNSQDPHQRELLYSERLTEWVMKLDPSAPEELRIAARGQHVQRWTLPREQYAMNRQGYLRWRETLKKFHAETVAGLMRESGYEEAKMERVKTLILKKNLRSDSDTQTLENALCLVFLQYQFAELNAKTAPEKMKDVLRKSWEKMSEKGRAEALKLSYADSEKQALKEAGII